MLHIKLFLLVVVILDCKIFIHSVKITSRLQGLHCILDLVYFFISPSEMQSPNSRVHGLKYAWDAHILNVHSSSLNALNTCFCVWVTSICMDLCGRMFLCICPLVMSLHTLVFKFTSKHKPTQMCVFFFYMLWQILCVIALRLCAENWLWHTGWCWGINLLHCHLQCRVAVFQWVSQSSEWNQWQCD